MICRRSPLQYRYRYAKGKENLNTPSTSLVPVSISRIAPTATLPCRPLCTTTWKLPSQIKDSAVDPLRLNRTDPNRLAMAAGCVAIGRPADAPATNVCASSGANQEHDARRHGRSVASPRLASPRLASVRACAMVGTQIRSRASESPNIASNLASRFRQKRLVVRRPHRTTVAALTVSTGVSRRQPPHCCTGPIDIARRAHTVVGARRGLRSRRLRFWPETMPVQAGAVVPPRRSLASQACQPHPCKTLARHATLRLRQLVRLQLSSSTAQRRA